MGDVLPGAILTLRVPVVVYYSWPIIVLLRSNKAALLNMNDDIGVILVVAASCNNYILAH